MTGDNSEHFQSHSIFGVVARLVEQLRHQSGASKPFACNGLRKTDVKQEIPGSRFTILSTRLAENDRNGTVIQSLGCGQIFTNGYAGAIR